MASYNKFNDFSQQLPLGTHHWSSDNFKIMLVNSPAPVAANSYKSDLVEIAAGNGYTAGGLSIGTVTISDVSGTTTLSANQVVFTASGGSIGPFQYAVLYNSTAGSGNLIAFWSYPNSITINDTETFTIKFNNTNPGTIFNLV